MNKKIIISALLILGSILLIYKIFVQSDESDLTDNATANMEIEKGDISIEFNQNKFTYGEEEALLMELRECDSTAETDRDPLRPACSPRFFKFFPLDNAQSLKNGFILVIKATVRGSETRKIKIYQREKGVLVLVNGFNGTPIKRIKSNSTYDDLIIRYGNRIENVLHYYICLYTWNGSQYQFKSCEEIDDRRVKKEFKDSMNLEIKTMLEKEHYQF